MNAKTNIVTIVKVGYWVANGGDGSVSVAFTQTEKEAEEAEEKDNEEYGDGWGEPSASMLNIYVDDKGNFYLQKSKFKDGKFDYSYHILETLTFLKS